MSALIQPTDDVDGLARLHDECFAPRGERVWSPTDFTDILAMAGSYCLGAFDGPRLCGFCITRQTVDEGELLSIGTNQAFRHKGIARALMAAALGHHGALGMRRLFLEVAADNQPAIHLYTSMGFTEQGIRPQYYKRADQVQVDALLLSLALVPD